MQGNKVVLIRSSVVTQSDATTMNSTPLILPTQSQTTASGFVGNRAFSGSSTTSGMAYIPPTGSTSVSTNQPTVPVLVDWRSHPRVPMAGKTIVIEGADATSLRYHVE